MADKTDQNKEYTLHTWHSVHHKKLTNKLKLTKQN